MKKRLTIFAFMAFLLIGCGGTTPSTPSDPSDPGQPTDPSEPTDPVDPPAPVDHKAVFCAARNATYESKTYQYDYTVEAKIKYKDAVSYSPAKIKGTVQWNKDAPETQYMSKRELSGILLFDSTSYTYNVGNDLVKLNADEKKDFSVVDHETINSGYDFESTSVGCVLKTLDTNDNLVVKKDDSGKYNLSLKTSFKNSFLNVLNYIDSAKILNALNNLTESKWGAGFSANCYATLDSSSEKIKSFHFDASVNVKDTVEVLFTLDQTFTSYAGGLSIKLPEFKDTYLSSSDIDSQLAAVRTAFDKNKMSYYAYDLKTSVDHGVSKSNPLGLAVDSHSQGYAERAVLDDEIYFHNGLELDSDYKNKDQYPDICDDYKFTRAKLNNENKEVYDVKDGVLKNTFNLIENYNNDEVDDFYMLINKDWLTSSTTKILRKSVDSKTNSTTYKLGLGSEGVKSILTFYNKHIRLSSDPDKAHIDVYQIFNDFRAKKADFTVTTNAEGDITEINILLKGFYNMSSTDDVKFSLKLKIKFDYSKSAYSIPTKTSEIKLPNFDVIG